MFDSFCGTGMSTASLAGRHPESLVIGIDKSAHLIGRHQGKGGGNYLLVQADCRDFWRLAAAANWRLNDHYLLYPNPWPKPGQLKQRLQGSAELEALLSLGGNIELRSNWQTYVEEFGVAMNIAGYTSSIDRVQPKSPLSLHERKYLQSGHQLWRCRCNLRQNIDPCAIAEKGGDNGHR